MNKILSLRFSLCFFILFNKSIQFLTYIINSKVFFNENGLKKLKDYKEIKNIFEIGFYINSYDII